MGDIDKTKGTEPEGKVVREQFPKQTQWLFRAHQALRCTCEKTFVCPWENVDRGQGFSCRRFRNVDQHERWKTRPLLEPLLEQFAHADRVGSHLSHGTP